MDTTPITEPMVNDAVRRLALILQDPYLAKQVDPRALVAQIAADLGVQIPVQRVCTCGAREFTGCFCDLTCAQFMASPGERHVN